MSSTVPTTPNERPLGLLGGTFDPIHFAHLRLAEVASAQFELERVIFIPAGRPWHRWPPHACAEDRLAMVRLAVANRPGFVVDDSEVRAGAPGYTVTTLEKARQTYGVSRPLVLLLGADAFLALAGWHRWRDVFGLAHIAVAARPGHNLDPAAMPPPLAQEYRQRLATGDTLATTPAGTITPFALSAGTVSATMIRQRRANGRGIRDLLPDDVVDYIDRRNLYPD
jgi:nicotinate-nucleotide adenylyltransferase